jgi:flagellar biosynthesis/type III secretory pathway protein FliH
MKIPIIKILDYRTKPALRKKLETSTNPMVMVVKAQLKSHEVKRSDNARKFEAARELIRQCYAHGYSKETTHLMIKFFDWVIRLPEVYKGRVKEVIKETEEEYKMEYVAIWERDIERSATKRGIEKGIEKGLAKGLAKGLLKKAKETAARMLEDGLPIETISKYTGLSAVDIKKMAPKSH